MLQKKHTHIHKITLNMKSNGVKTIFQGGGRPLSKWDE